MKSIIFSAVLLFVCSFTIAQDANPSKGWGVVTGQVFDKTTNQPVEYANVILYKSSDSSLVTGGVTDLKGNYNIERIPFGQYYLVANFIGYQKFTLNKLVVDNDNKNLKLEPILLLQTSSQLAEVNVVADKSLVEYKVDKKVINVSQNLNASGGSAVDVLASAPSVNTDENGNVLLRGSGNFTVLIDGKPTTLNANDILKQTPASAIENIEIITNPSAKYDAEGTSGIINLVMKKNKTNGISGIINASAGLYNRYTSDFMINYRSKKFSLNTGMEFMSNEFQMNSNFNSKYFYDTLLYINNHTDRLMKRDNIAYKLGAEYFISDKTSVSYSGTVGYSEFSRKFNSFYENYTDPITDDFYSTTDDDFMVYAKYLNNSLTHSYRFKPKGNELISSIFYSVVDAKTNQNSIDGETNNQYQLIDLTPGWLKSVNENSRYETRFKTDYTLAVNEKSKFEAGAQVQLYQRIADVIYKNYDYTNQIWLTNSTFSNKIDFNQNVYAAYTTYSGTMATIEYQAGLRLEYTDRVLDQLTSNKSYDFKQFDYFPSLSLSKKLTPELQLQGSYSRRISRPNEFILNPFPDYSDSYYISVGNPDLKPEYIDSYELNLQKYIKSSFVSFEAYYRQTNNKIQRAFDLQDNGQMLLTSVNINRDFSLGGEIMVNLDFVKWWKFNTSVNLYQYYLENVNDGNTSLTSRFTWNLRANSTFIVTPDTRIQITGNYNSKSIISQGTTKEMWGVNIALKQDFMKKKLTVSLNIQDIFKTNHFGIETTDPKFQTMATFYPKAPAASISVSYKINNYKRSEKQNGTEIDINGGTGF